MKKLSTTQQDSRFLLSALSLAIQLNAGGPTKIVRTLAQRWCSYFYSCAITTQPAPILYRIAWAVLTLRPHAEIRLIRLQRNVCIQALAKDPDIDLLIDAIQAEREAWERGILGKSWSAPAMTAIRSAIQVGISWRDASRAIRSGQVRFKKEGPEPATIRPVAAGLLMGVVTFAWFAGISYNMFVLHPKAFGENLLALGGGIGVALWIGRSVYASTRDEKDLISRMVNARRPQVVSKRAQ